MLGTGRPRQPPVAVAWGRNLKTRQRGITLQQQVLVGGCAHGWNRREIDRRRATCAQRREQESSRRALACAYLIPTSTHKIKDGQKENTFC
jgi:hypothetical protein